jgi:SET family sugar efflux transporter-like MFS transporter
MSFANTLSRRLPDSTSLAFLAIAFLSGIASALQIPTLSLFLSTEIQVSPFMVGLFFTVNAIMGIAVSQILASWSDKKSDRKKLILGCCLLGALGCVLFAFNRHYYFLMIFGILLASFGSTANPQMFALAREHADRTGREAAVFSSVMRAQISLAWVIGPPLAFALALGFGFPFMYCAAALAFLACASMVAFALPSMPMRHMPRDGVLQSPRKNRRDTLLLFIACTLMWSANSIYLINMPLYIAQELHLSARLAGILMGSAAGLEIPIMLAAGVLAKRLGKRCLMRISVIAGTLFYVCIIFCHTAPLLIALQLLNAVFIGILAGIGMLYFQDLMPGQAGAATTLFTNSGRTGWIVAGSLAGLIAQFFDFHAVFYLGLFMMLVAIICLWRMK